MNAHLDDRLSAYLDGELEGGDLLRAETHLADCAECRAALEDLRAIVAGAGALESTPPATDLWAGIAERIADAPPGVVSLAPRRRRFSFTVPQLAAAAIALMAVSAMAVWQLQPDRLVVAAAPALTPAGDDGIARPAGYPGAATYNTAIAELQTTLAARRGRLDTATVRVLEQSLAVIDQAIVQAREALARDPNNFYLNSHLQSALDRKLDLLRRVISLPTVS